MRLTLRTAAVLFTLIPLFPVWSADSSNSASLLPSSVLFGEYNGTYERAIAANLSLGVTPYYRNTEFDAEAVVSSGSGETWTAGCMFGLFLYLDHRSFQGLFTGVQAGAGYVRHRSDSGSYTGLAVRPALTLGYRYNWGRFSLIPQITTSYYKLATLRSDGAAPDTPEVPLSGFSSIWGIGVGWTF